MLILFILLSSSPSWADLRLPVGFSLSEFAHIPGARSLAPAPEIGAVFVGSRGSAIHMIVDHNHDGKADNVIRLINSLKVPNGIAWKDGYLYVAEQHRLIRFHIGDQRPKKLRSPEVLFDKFPDRRWHGWRYAKFGPDGGLYISIGAPCNICSLRGQEGTILRFDPTSWVPSIFAKGVRNSVGFDFDPITQDLIFSDNGADHMGDDLPPDELNRAPLGGLHFGYPYFGGGDTRTTEFLRHQLPENRLPIHKFQAHVAPLGVHFYQGKRFPEYYRQGVFVAQHGSWNRSIPVGYQISFLAFDHYGKVLKEEAFISGWLNAEHDVSGRPVDLTTWADGRLLISDDSEDKVYIVDYHK
ncbi:PQQ-dependent sugar dehydrogenase [Terasakiella sp. SH-1]|uniref:PQQ-dependent sugar dehydrogenase n=1 Tax=Terasakiella sp. SH-1 TaxID=2560057 RepID=UPI001431A450|nr:PQQ-dependent sugar dehydrogenase [Terasakiella sp. SH-1]